MDRPECTGAFLCFCCETRCICQAFSRLSLLFNLKIQQGCCLHLSKCKINMNSHITIQTSVCHLQTDRLVQALIEHSSQLSKNVCKDLAEIHIHGWLLLLFLEREALWASTGFSPHLAPILQKNSRAVLHQII